MFQHQKARDDRQYTGQEFQAPPRGIDEDADDPEDARDEQIKAQHLHHEEQYGPRCHQQHEPENGGNDPLYKNQPPRQGLAPSAGVRTHSPPPASLIYAEIPLWARSPHGSQYCPNSASSCPYSPKSV